LKEFKMDKSIRATVVVALFAALMVVGAYIAVPVGPVPVVLATLFVLLSGMLAGPGIGAAAVGVYLLLGIVGLPVFANGAGGIQVFVGPTGGYLLGYLLASWTAGMIVRAGKGRLSVLIIAAVVGSVMIYLPGVPWLHRWFVLNKDSGSWTWNATVLAGVTPFLIGDAVKAVVAIVLTGLFRERFITLLRRR
jgi:biotin transport system substrate-specific component